MIIEYEWVNREPFLEYDGYNVENWLFQLCAKGWLTEESKIARSGDAEAVGYRSQSVEIEQGHRQHVTGYEAGQVHSMSEAYRKIHDWDRKLKVELSGELYGPRSIPNWNNSTLQVSGDLDL